jgi:flagellar motility protein MotE (MotC chaperone)
MMAGVKSGRSTLVIIALLFASSGALRLGSGGGRAMANGVETPMEIAHPVPETCAELPAALATALTAREAAVAAGEAELNDRTAAIALAQTAIEQRLAELQMAEEKLSATLAIADQAAERDLARLTSVYETMKPKDAAALFETMAPPFAAGFLGRMQPQAAAAVMSGLKPETAYQISLVLAGRNAAAPTE